MSENDKQQAQEREMDHVAANAASLLKPTPDSLMDEVTYLRARLATADAENIGLRQQLEQSQREAGDLLVRLDAVMKEGDQAARIAELEAERDQAIEAMNTISDAYDRTLTEKNRYFRHWMDVAKQRDDLRAAAGAALEWMEHPLVWRNAPPIQGYGETADALQSALSGALDAPDTTAIVRRMTNLRLAVKTAYAALMIGGSREFPTSDGRKLMNEVAEALQAALDAGGE